MALHFLRFETEDGPVFVEAKHINAVCPQKGGAKGSRLILTNGELSFPESPEETVKNIVTDYNANIQHAGEQLMKQLQAVQNTPAPKKSEFN